MTHAAGGPSADSSVMHRRRSWPRKTLICVALLASCLRLSTADAVEGPATPQSPPRNPSNVGSPDGHFQLQAVALGPTISFLMDPRPVFDPGGELSLFFGRPGGKWSSGLTVGGSRERVHAEAQLAGYGDWMATIVGAGACSGLRATRILGGQVSVSETLLVLLLPTITASLSAFPEQGADWITFEVGFSVKIGGGF
jgi:hypothetical protein